MPRIRSHPYDYHFHAYDYLDSVAGELSPLQLPENSRPKNGQQFYSLVADLEDLRVTGLANHVPAIRIDTSPTVDRNGRRIRTLCFGDPDSPGVSITGGIHAREWIAPEMAYLVAEYLIVNHPPGRPANEYEREIRDLVRSRWIQITPMLNPSGIDYTIFDPTANARDWRKNRRALPADGQAWMATLTAANQTKPPFQNATLTQGDCSYDVPLYDGPGGIPPRAPSFKNFNLLDGETGVDLNRNLPARAWGYEGQPNAMDSNAEADSDTYFGPQAGSETETSYFAAYLGQTRNLQVAIDYHAYGQYIVYPPEAYDAGNVTESHKALGRVLQSLIGPAGAKGTYKLGAGRDLLGYDGTGSVSDHIAQRHGARTFTVELDPAGNGNGVMGFRLPEVQICPVFEQNIRGALALIAAAGVQSPLDTLKTASRFGGWNVFGRGNQLPQ